MSGLIATLIYYDWDFVQKKVFSSLKFSFELNLTWTEDINVFRIKPRIYEKQKVLAPYCTGV